MAKAKKETKAKEEVVEEVKEETNESLETEVTESNIVEAGVIDDEAPQPIERQTPFGVEVWDPIEKRTVLKDA
ncbi:hypothetical protein [Enterococcus faecalis]|uniref:hypothetical protein n=1 Tax=Enterococcus faecalis TaxID=1351 RepID=UPI0015605B2F|nr:MULTISPECIES: hypothetical protein [Bacteria]EHU8862207.1 hypothetical protein [Enterococcus faecalis]MDL4975331.1 hypothetical protein [Enterococcus faecalis]MDL5349811.1 hypothetical protein [Proteus faecis]NRE00150.1 hypothetical protein [Enterococcus faecalis]NRE04128.1 hypothetical protein [Enterococcus faecalis]